MLMGLSLSKDGGRGQKSSFSNLAETASLSFDNMEFFQSYIN